jgi:hypothetical protein
MRNTEMQRHADTSEFRQVTNWGAIKANVVHRDDVTAEEFCKDDRGEYTVYPGCIAFNLEEQQTRKEQTIDRLR